MSIDNLYEMLVNQWWKGYFHGCAHGAVIGAMVGVLIMALYYFIRTKVVATQ